MEEELRREIVDNQLFITFKKIDRSNPIEEFETIETRCYPILKEELKAPSKIKLKKETKVITIPGILFFAHEVAVWRFDW